MSRVLIVLVWIIALIVDGAILPALRIGLTGFGAMVFLIALILTFGLHRWVIGWGIVLAFAAEIILGLYFGTLIGAWLVVAWGWYGINRFFSMTSSDGSGSRLAVIPLTGFGILLFIAGELSQWFIARVFYDHGLMITTAKMIIISPQILIIAGLELAVLLLVLRLIPVRNLHD